jgi:hypothetical protein
MPCHNAAGFARRAICSVLAQVLPSWELIAIDDGSTDETEALLRSFGDPRIRVLTQDNQGVSRSRNRGIATARGSLVAFLDADDEWHADFLARMTAALERQADAVLAYCGWQNVGLEGQRSMPFVPAESEGDSRMRWLIGGCRWPIHAAMARTAAVRGAGGFPVDQTHAEDFALWLRVAMSGSIVRVPEVLAVYHFHGYQQASANRTAAILQAWKTQCRFLAERPDIAKQLGRRAVRDATHGQLVDRGLEAHWRRDFVTSRAVFGQLAAVGYLPPRTWTAVAALLLPSFLRSKWLWPTGRPPT